MIWNLHRRAQAARKQDLLGLDFGASALKAVHVRRGKDRLCLVGVGLFDPVDLSGAGEVPVSLPAWPDTLRSNYAAVCTSYEGGSVRILPLAGAEESEAQIREQMSAGADMRVMSLPLTPSNVKPPRVLAASFPERCVDTCLDLFGSGAPAACSLELSGLATLSASLYAMGPEAAESALCLMDVGARFSHVFFLNKGVPVLVRKYDVGTDRLLERMGEELGVDRQTALGVLQEGAIDFSSVFRDVMAPMVRQIVISRDFVERQEKCRLGRILCSGAVSASLFWRQMLRDTSAMEVECWSPFDRLEVEPDAIPEVCQGQEIRFAGALGAALGVMESC